MTLFKVLIVIIV